MPKKRVSRAVPGPKPDIVKLKGDWEDAVGKALAKKPPADGFTNQKKPKPTK